MISFYNNVKIENEHEITSNAWHQILNFHYFKLPVSFCHNSRGTQIRVQDLNQTKTYPETGFFLPEDDGFHMYFLTDFSNNSVELVTQIYASYDVFCMEDKILQNYFYYKIPWFFIPKNYLDFEPKHLIMMFNMGYLMQHNPNNTTPNNMYYNKYYLGIDVTKYDIEDAYSKYILDNFSMDNIIVKDFLNI